VSDGRFRVRIKALDPKTGKLKEVKKVLAAATAAEAASAKEELRLEFEAGRTQAHRLRLTAYASSWLTGKLRVLKPSTANRYAQALDLHILPVLGDHYLDAIEPIDIVRWRDGQEGKSASVNGRLRILKTLLRDAVAELGLPRDASARVHALREAHSECGPNRLTAEQLAKVLHAFRDHETHWYPLFLFLALTAARVSEGTALRWEDVDFEEAVVHICRAHWKGIVGTTKTGSSRTVPLPTILADTLKDHRRRLIEAQAPGLASGYVFLSKKGTIIRGSSLQKPLERALGKAGIADRFTIHGFRRTFNNLLRQATTGEVVRSMTGHVTERMTEHYSHVEVDEKHKAVNAVLHLVSTAKSGTLGGRSAEATVSGHPEAAV